MTKQPPKMPKRPVTEEDTYNMTRLGYEMARFAVGVCFFIGLAIIYYIAT